MTTGVEPVVMGKPIGIRYEYGGDARFRSDSDVCGSEIHVDKILFMVVKYRLTKYCLTDKIFVCTYRARYL